MGPHRSSEAERRAHRRATLDRPVLLEGRDRTATVRSVDVSGGGIAIRVDPASPLRLQPAARVQLYFELPIGYPIETSAEIVRAERDVIALRFVDTSREALTAIRSFCRLSGQHPTVQPRTLVPSARVSG